jgi:Protein of unknown function (DUF3102)
MSDALSLVGPINQAYNNLKTSYRTSLTHALELGGLLIKAKEAVNEHGKWKPWLEKNCPQIHYRTAAVYMQLAKDREGFTDDPANVQSAALLGAEGDLTISDALNALNRKNGGLGKPKVKGERKPKEKTSHDLATVLPDSAPDEVSTVINKEWDVGKRSKLIEDQLGSVPTSVLSAMLIKVLDSEDVQDLIVKLQASLKPKPETAAQPKPLVTPRVTSSAQPTA